MCEFTQFCRTQQHDIGSDRRNLFRCFDIVGSRIPSLHVFIRIGKRIFQIFIVFFNGIFVSLDGREFLGTGTHQDIEIIEFMIVHDLGIRFRNELAIHAEGETEAHRTDTFGSLEFLVFVEEFPGILSSEFIDILDADVVHVFDAEIFHLLSWTRLHEAPVDRTALNGDTVDDTFHQRRCMQSSCTGSAA